jgi:hypothetical protein
MTAISVRLIIDRETQILRANGYEVAWHGLGDVQVVSEEIAKKASIHTDVFEIIGEAKGKKALADVPLKKVEEEQEKTEMPALVDINVMDKSALTAYALREFGQQIDAKWSADRSRKYIQDLMGRKLYGRS